MIIDGWQPDVPGHTALPAEPPAIKGFVQSANICSDHRQRGNDYVDLVDSLNVLLDGLSFGRD